MNEAAIKKKYSFGKDRIETGENSVLVSGDYIDRIQNWLPILLSILFVTKKLLGTIRGSKPRGLNTEKKVTMKLDPEDDYTLSHEIEVYEALIKSDFPFLCIRYLPLIFH